MIQGLELVGSEPLPAKQDVVVIGGGIVGVSTALFLAEKGLSVTLVEKGAIGGEQSSQNWGWVRKMGRDPREMALMIAAETLWSRFTLEDGLDTGYNQNGITYFADSQADIRRYDEWLHHTASFGLDTRILSSGEAMEKAGGSTRTFAGALHTPSDGMAEPTLAAPALAKAARQRGAKIITNCAARNVALEAGKVVGLHTEQGLIQCSHVVVAGGGWSSMFLRAHGIRLPQLKLTSQVMRTSPVDAGLEGCGSGNGFGFRKRRDGGYNLSARGNYPVDIVPDSFRFFGDYRSTVFAELRSMRFRLGKRSWEEFTMPSKWRADQVSPFERFRSYQPATDRKALDKIMRGIETVFPAMKDAQILEYWAGLIDTTPDALPVISPIDSHPGLFVSTGYSGHGFGIAPAAGLLMAGMIAGEEPIVDPTDFRFSRFSDGSPIKYWPLGL